MKKVVQNKSTTEVEVSAVTLEKYYGIQSGRGTDDKGFITREKFGNGNFQALAAYKLTDGNGWDGFLSSDLKGLIQSLLDNGNFLVFEFNNSQELFTWLGQP
jgi:hypothetical protein